MSNKEIFSRTFGFSVRRFFFSILSFIVIGGVFSGIFYFIALQFKDAFAQLALFVQEMAAGMNDIPTEDSFRVLDGRSAKFRKMHEQIV